jgi:CRISPR system Cascade subunit CasB
MSDETTGAWRDRAGAFVEHLRVLGEDDDRGALAALRSSLQEPGGIGMRACPHVVPFLPPEPDRYRERAFFLVGALFALHPEHAEGVSIGHAFRRINADTAEGQTGGDNESTRARFVALLDAHEDDLAEHLRHAVSLARAKEIRLDWARLLRDVLQWRAPDRWVQRRLAADFWGGGAPVAASSHDGAAGGPMPQGSLGRAEATATPNESESPR